MISRDNLKKIATFEQVWQLYQFDLELRLLVADAIEKRSSLQTK